MAHSGGVGVMEQSVWSFINIRQGGAGMGCINILLHKAFDTLIFDTSSVLSKDRLHTSFQISTLY